MHMHTHSDIRIHTQTYAHTNTHKHTLVLPLYLGSDSHTRSALVCKLSSTIDNTLQFTTQINRHNTSH